MPIRSTPARHDIGMYAQTLMLVMTARGVASCAQGARPLSDIVRKHLGLGADQRLLFGIPLVTKIEREGK